MAEAGDNSAAGQSIPCTAWGWRWFAPGCCQPRLLLLAGEEQVGAGEHLKMPQKDWGPFLSTSKWAAGNWGANYPQPMEGVLRQDHAWTHGRWTRGGAGNRAVGAAKRPVPAFPPGCSGREALI